MREDSAVSGEERRGGEEEKEEVFILQDIFVSLPLRVMRECVVQSCLHTLLCCRSDQQQSETRLAPG